MGCQCINKEEERKSEILKKESDEENNDNNEENQHEDNNDNKNSISRDNNIFGLNSNHEENQDKFSLENQEPKSHDEEVQNMKKDKNLKYANYPEKMLELINKIREDPVSYADVIEDSIQNIIEDQNKKIYKKKVKVALYKGEEAFEEAAQELRNMPSLPPLELKTEICVPLPEDKGDIKNSYYLKEQVKIIKEKNNIDVFFKDLIKIPEVSALLMIVDDSEKNPGKKRKTLLNKDFKYIGISSKFIGNTFIAYFSFST